MSDGFLYIGNFTVGGASGSGRIRYAADGKLVNDSRRNIVSAVILDGPHKGQRVDTFPGVNEVELEYIQGEEYVTATYRRVNDDTFELAK